jgi:Rod binding domain-containing protein
MDPLKLTPTVDSNSIRLVNPARTVTNSSQGALSSDEKIRKAAQGFERTLVRQMLSIVRSTNIRGGEVPSTTSTGYLEILDDKVADQLTAGKGLGFGSKMAEQLIRQINAKNVNGLPENAVNNSLTTSNVVVNQ